MENNIQVVIIGAGPAGLAVAACLNSLGISNITLERESCCASLFKERSYDRLKLHLAKEFCQLPYKPFPSKFPTYVPRHELINYLDDYASSFGIQVFYGRDVQSAHFDVNAQKWNVKAKDVTQNRPEEIYKARFLIVATGENSQGIIPAIPGLYSFDGMAMHSSQYKNGQRFSGKNVLVVGSGNSGMEIAYDLADWGAHTSIVVRNPVHIVTKEMIFLGMKLLKFVPINIVDNLVVALSKCWYGTLAKFGIKRPEKGPFLYKRLTGKSPVIDVGTVRKIKRGEIEVFPGIEKIDRFSVKFRNDITKSFDAIVFATGYKSTVNKWLKDDARLFNEEGMPKKTKPDHWKGEDGIYCVGFGRSGLLGITEDALRIADDINFILEDDN